MPSNIVLMRYQTDCEVAALATALGITWEQARDALDWQRLPKGTENPVFGNPWNLYRALVSLGYWKRNVTMQMLLNGDCEPMKTIVLVKKSLTQQHYVVWGGIDSFGNHRLYWGDSERPVLKSVPELTSLYRKAWPNMACQAYKANVFRIMLERFKIWAGITKKEIDK